MKILMVASEATPFAKTGGLADVVGALPPALSSQGHDIRLVMPWYRCVRKVAGPLRKSRAALTVPMGGQVWSVAWRHSQLDDVSVYFIDVPEFYDRAGLYGEQGQDYPDNDLRFGLLCRAALELARKLDFAPDIVHAHDWQASLAPVFLRQKLWRDPHFLNTGSLLSIHNLGYQGLFPVDSLLELDLDSSLFSADMLEYYGQVSLLKGGIRFADRINTVSPSYCREIQTPEFGMGLDGLLHSRSDQLHGILNGLDGELWNPVNDQALPSNYSAKNLDGKAICKELLQQELGLQQTAKVPVAAMVTRLDSQKGFDLLLDIWDEFLDRKIQLVILGSGSPRYEQQLLEQAGRFPGRVVVRQGFDDPLARRIYAGSDLFLMPSRYEPCGLGQLIALRYGSVPLVHSTGGLADTIIDPRENLDRANGFRFNEYSGTGLIEGLDRTLSTYSRRQDWKKLVLRGMRQDFSWERAADNYIQLYRRIRSDRSG